MLTMPIRWVPVVLLRRLHHSSIQSPGKDWSCDATFSPLSPSDLVKRDLTARQLLDSDLPFISGGAEINLLNFNVTTLTSLEDDHYRGLGSTEDRTGQR